jgi:hypothetical protein
MPLTGNKKEGPFVVWLDQPFTPRKESKPKAKKKPIEVVEVVESIKQVMIAPRPLNQGELAELAELLDVEFRELSFDEQDKREFLQECFEAHHKVPEREAA